MLKQALKVGVDYDLFWKLNPKSLQPFFEAYKEKQEDELDKLNFQGWLNGVYIQRAIGSALSKKNKYFSEPINIKGGQKLNPQEKYEDIKNRFVSKAKRHNKNLRKGG